MMVFEKGIFSKHPPLTPGSCSHFYSTVFSGHSPTVGLPGTGKRDHLYFGSEETSQMILFYSAATWVGGQVFPSYTQPHPWGPSLPPSILED